MSGIMISREVDQYENTTEPEVRKGIIVKPLEQGYMQVKANK